MISQGCSMYTAQLQARSQLIQAKKGNKPSWIWTSLIEGRDFARRNGQWSIANGEKIKTWEDKWLCNGKSLATYKKEESYILKDLIHPSSNSGTPTSSGTYSPDQAFAGPSNSQLAWYQQKDVLVWPHSLSGTYSVKIGPNPKATLIQARILAAEYILPTTTTVTTRPNHQGSNLVGSHWKSPPPGFLSATRMRLGVNQGRQHP
ncbi:hypothetical protein SESBI_35685 [Sesbania bispinosa]|nr:hypothetical protein SESBI_35685 [Sesbania bispinosa]